MQIYLSLMWADIKMVSLRDILSDLACFWYIVVSEQEAFVQNQAAFAIRQIGCTTNELNIAYQTYTWVSNYTQTI